MISGGVKENVLPSQAYVLINFRILPGNTPDDVVAHAKKVIADPAVEVSIYRGRRIRPSPVSATIISLRVSDGFPYFFNHNGFPFYLSFQLGCDLFQNLTARSG
ncbi:MAG: peptidase dimerization domain-containing protein [Proteobacteria bacterium]|nr:peptidase dimerization domain-containing protein [Pseudomonadota bacterium]